MGIAQVPQWWSLSSLSQYWNLIKFRGYQILISKGRYLEIALPNASQPATVYFKNLVIHVKQGEIRFESTDHESENTISTADIISVRETVFEFEKSSFGAFGFAKSHSRETRAINAFLNDGNGWAYS